MESFRWDRVFAVSDSFPKRATINVLDNVSRTGSKQISFSVRYDPKFYIKFGFLLPVKDLPNFFNTSSFQDRNIRGTDHNCVTWRRKTYHKRWQRITLPLVRNRYAWSIVHLLHDARKIIRYYNYSHKTHR